MIHSAIALCRGYRECVGSINDLARCSRTSILRGGFGGTIRCVLSVRLRMPGFLISAGLYGVVFRDESSADRAGNAAADSAVAAILFGALGARQLMERLEYDLLFRWFVGARSRRPGLGSLKLLEEPRPAAGRGDRGLVPRRCAGPRPDKEAAFKRAPLVDGTLIEGWASMESCPRTRATRAAAPRAAGAAHRPT